MEPEQCREYRRLQDDIIGKLREHAFIDDREAHHGFQYLILPAFDPPVSWDVFRQRHRGREDTLILVRTVWRSDVDVEKLQSPVERLRHPYPLIPTIEVHQLHADPGELSRLAADLANLSLPIGAPRSVSGVDGVHYEVAIEQPPHDNALAAKCRLSWWCQPPVEWEGLATWCGRAEALFESAWLARGPAMPMPLQIKVIDDAATRLEAQRLFHAGLYGQAAERLAEIGTRTKLTPAEKKMLELALKRSSPAL